MKNTFLSAFAVLFLLVGNPAMAENSSIEVKMTPVGDEVTLPDGSTFQYHQIDDARWYELLKLDTIVGRHCIGEECKLLDPNGDELKIDWQQVAVVATIVVIRVVKPNWLPNWLTGRSSGTSTSTATGAAAGPALPIGGI